MTGDPGSTATRPTARPVARAPEIGDVGWFALKSQPRPMSDFTEMARDAQRDEVMYHVIGLRSWRE